MTAIPSDTEEKRVLKTFRSAPVFLAACVFLSGGCTQKKMHAVAWATAIQVRPTAPQAQTGNSNATANSAPDLRIELPPPPLELAGRRTGPARPRAAAANPDEAVNQENSPNLAPQLSPQELGLVRQQANESLGIAEHNLRLAQGRRLNAMQADLVSKISGFASEARRAAGEGDWTRARNLAKKAQVLSEELADQF